MTREKRSFFPAPESFVLYASMFVMGGCGLAYEYTLSKLSSDLLGNSVEQWAIIIGVMMFFMGVGSDVQKYLSDHGLLTKFILAEIALGLCGAFSPILILEAYGRFAAHFILVQYFFIASIGLLIGFEIPLLARINAAYSESIQFNLGGVLKMDYIGALFGALAWVFILPKFFSTTEMAFVLGLATLCMAAIALVYFRKQLEHPYRLLLLNGFALLMVSVGLFNAGQWTSHAEQALYRDQIVHLETSKFQHAVVTKSPAGQVSLYINGHLQFNQQDEFIYHENLVHPVMAAASSRERVLVLGGGDGLAVREVLKYEDVREVILCDLDPMIVELARSHPSLSALNEGSLQNARVITIPNQALLDSKEEQLWQRNQKALGRRAQALVGKVKVLNLDAMKFLEQFAGRYNVVILDFPDPNSPELSKLYSRSFYRLLKQRLQPEGLIVQQSTSPFYAKEAFLAIGRTMQESGFAAIPYHDNVPSMGDWGFWVAGLETQVSESTLRDRLEKSKIFVSNLRHLNKERMAANFVFGKDQLAAKHQEVNTMTRPVIYDYYRQGWQDFF